MPDAADPISLAISKLRQHVAEARRLRLAGLRLAGLRERLVPLLQREQCVAANASEAAGLLLPYALAMPLQVRKSWEGLGVSASWHCWGWWQGHGKHRRVAGAWTAQKGGSVAEGAVRDASAVLPVFDVRCKENILPHSLLLSCLLPHMLLLSCRLQRERRPVPSAGTALEQVSRRMTVLVATVRDAQRVLQAGEELREGVRSELQLCIRGAQRLASLHSCTFCASSAAVLHPGQLPERLQQLQHDLEAREQMDKCRSGLQTQVCHSALLTPDWKSAISSAAISARGECDLLLLLQSCLGDAQALLQQELGQVEQAAAAAVSWLAPYSEQLSEHL